MRLYLFTWKHWHEAEPGPAVETQPGPAVEAEPQAAVETESGQVVGTERGPAVDRASGLALRVVARLAPERRVSADPEAVHQLQQSDSSEESFGFPARSTALFDP